MAPTREDLVKMARAAVGGLNRPSDLCTATFVQPWGEAVTMDVACEHSVRNPAAYDPPEWVIDAMINAYQRGDRDGYNRCAAQPPLYPEGG